MPFPIRNGGIAKPWAAPLTNRIRPLQLTHLPPRLDACSSPQNSGRGNSFALQLTTQGTSPSVLALENPHDPHQQWIKVDSWGLRVKDEAGFPVFALVNKATRHALKHEDKEWDQIYLADYNHDKAEQSVLWTLSADVGNRYQCLRPVNNINLNMDVKAADSHVGGIRDGNELILFEWKKQSN
eukprot:PITA_09208